MEWLTAFTEDLQQSWPALWHGLSITLKVVVSAAIGGVIIGTLLALMRLSSIKAFNWFAKGYVNLFRSIPLLLVLMWFYFAVPFIYTGITGNYLTIDTALVSSIVAFMLFEAAYFSEIVRAGIQSIPKGQIEAAYSLGIRPWNTMRYVVLPQAIKNILPALGNEFVTIIKVSSLLQTIGVMELWNGAQTVATTTYLTLTPLLFAAFYYLIVTTAMTALLKQMEKRLGKGRK